MNRETVTPLLIPGAIVFGAIIIALAVLFGNPVGDAAVNTAAIAPAAQPGAAPAQVVSGVGIGRSENARRYGSPDAAQTIVEFSDLECPFCARLHPVLKRIVDESDGSVNWEYRHLPLPLHRNARAAAIASECVAKLGVEGSFWTYIDTLLSNIGRAKPDYLLQEAVALGISKTSFTQCLTDSEMVALVDGDMAKARELGGSGTPFSLIVDNKAKTARVVSGAVPYEQWQELLRPGVE